MTPDERLEQHLRGENPRAVAKLSSGYLEMAENQFLIGYCILLAYPKVGQLLELPVELQQAFLSDMARAGEIIRRVTGALRCNFAIYGNQDPFLHAHIWPRFENEPDNRKSLPPLGFPAEVRENPATNWTPEMHGSVLRSLSDQFEAI